MKLGLIAMSGVRAHNPELTALGLTLPGFVERNKVIASLPSLGLLTLAGLTPPSVDTHYLEIPDIAAIDGVPEEFDVVAISSFSAQINEAYALADRYRALGTKATSAACTSAPSPTKLAPNALMQSSSGKVNPLLAMDHDRLVDSAATLRPVDLDARACAFDFAELAGRLRPALFCLIIRRPCRCSVAALPLRVLAPLPPPSARLQGQTHRPRLAEA